MKSTLLLHGPALLLAFVLAPWAHAGAGTPPAKPGSASQFQWLVLSPIPVTPGSGEVRPDEAAQKAAFASDLLAARGGEANVRPVAGEKYTVNGVERQWTATGATHDVVSLNSPDGKGDYQLAYAAAEFDSPADGPAWLGVGSDDSVRVWLNGTLVHEHWVSRGVRVDQDVVPVRLQKGKNHLVLKVQNIAGLWGFACRLLDASRLAERLVAAAMEGDQSTLAELAGRGLNLNARTADGLTPYGAAVLWGQMSTAEFLAKKGVDTRAAVPPLAALADRICRAWNHPDTPGVSVAITDHGRIVFAKGYGCADLEYGVPIKPDTIFHVASVSKQFTAMAVVLLEADGKLAIDDDVHKVLPELPDYGAKITLRNLLQHTSGIRDQWQLLALAGWDMRDVITQDQILRMLFRQKKLNFPPGKYHLYSNSGFTLLAEIVARVSGKPFPEFCTERIFTPLGMTHTHFHQRLEQLVPGRAYSYEKGANGYEASPLNYANAGATSLFTTAEDLVKWLDNFRTGRVGGPTGIARMQEEGVLIDGKKIGYGLGVALGEHRGLHTIAHGGADAGYRSFVDWFPDAQWGVAVLANGAECDPYELAESLASVCLHDRLAPADAKPKTPEPKFVDLDPKALELYPGVYPLPGIGQTIIVIAEHGRLWAAGPVRPSIELRPTGPGKFFVQAFHADIEFEPTADGEMKLRVIQPGAVNEGVRTGPVTPAEKDLAPYAGTYWSEELETQYRFSVHDGKLFGMHAHHGEFALTPTIRDRFTTELWCAPQAVFVRDGKGAIAGLFLGGDRINGVWFARRPDTCPAPTAPSPATE